MTTASTPFVGDPFAELGVSQTASRDEIRRAFRRRARETHPDHQPDDPGAAQRFARLHAAYQEALARMGQGDRRERAQPRGARAHGDGGRERKGITEHELALRVQEMRDPAALRGILMRHGDRPIIGAVLARNPAFPTDALPALRRLTEGHWTVEAAIAGRADVTCDMLLAIARLAREPVVGMAIVGNDKSTAETLDTLVQGPVRLDPALENALAAHPDLSATAAARLAARHATNVAAVVRLIERSDLPEELVHRLATQTTRPPVAAAARYDLSRRGLPTPPLRGPQRPPKTQTGYWR